jgi:hypothetical protein
MPVYAVPLTAVVCPENATRPALLMAGPTAVPGLPDLIVCRPELADAIVAFVRTHGTD